MPFPASHNQGSPILELENPGRCDLQRKILASKSFELTLTRERRFFALKSLSPLAVTACQGYRRDNRTEVRSM